MHYSIPEFESLYIRCFPPALRLAMSLLHDEDEASDLAHEVFLKLWESNTELSSPAAFVLRAVRNASINRLNSLSVREKIKRKLMLEEPPEDFHPDARSEAVQSAIRGLLTPREKQVVEKVFSDGLSYKATAESLEISTAAVNKHIVAALRKLRTHFNEHKEEYHD